MRDPDLERLLEAMDAAVGRSDGPARDVDVGSELELAELRLRCIDRRLNGAVSASPYLRYLRSSIRRMRPEPLAASA